MGVSYRSRALPKLNGEDGCKSRLFPVLCKFLGLCCSIPLLHEATVHNGMGGVWIDPTITQWSHGRHSKMGFKVILCYSRWPGVRERFAWCYGSSCYRQVLQCCIHGCSLGLFSCPHSLTLSHSHTLYAFNFYPNQRHPLCCCAFKFGSYGRIVL